MPVSWELRKQAAIEYASHRPLLEATTWQPFTLGEKYPLPEGVFDVEFLDYGPRVTLQELASAAEGEQGWCVSGGMLYVVPAPGPAVPIGVVWRKLHPADELNEGFPTIPPTDQIIVTWLAEAEALEQEAEATSGLASYSIGSTKVQWSQQGGGGPSSASRAQRLRMRALAALTVPAAEWG